MTEVLAAEPGFPPLFLHLLRVGEETSQLDSMLLRVVEIFDAEVKRKIEQSLALLVPVVTLALGALVALIIGAILAAIFQVNELAF